MLLRTFWFIFTIHQRQWITLEYCFSFHISFISLMMTIFFLIGRFGRENISHRKYNPPKMISGGRNGKWAKQYEYKCMNVVLKYCVLAAECSPFVVIVIAFCVSFRFIHVECSLVCRSFVWRHTFLFSPNVPTSTLYVKHTTTSTKTDGAHVPNTPKGIIPTIWLEC